MKERKKINFFSHIKPLVAMQLKDKIDFSFLKNKKKAFFKIIWTLLEFVLLVAVIYLFFSLIVKFGLLSFLQILNFKGYSVLMTVVFSLSFLSCLLSVTHTLYFSKDNSVLLTMPVKNDMVFLSKLIVNFIYELLKNTMYILPFFFAYGLVMNLSITFYLWSILSLLFFTLLSVSISGFLSIPAMLIGIAFKRHKTFEYITLAIVVGLGVFAIVKVIDLLPVDIDLVRDWGKIYWDIQDFLNIFVSKFYIFVSLTSLLTGMTYSVYSFSPFTTNNLLTFINCSATIIMCFLLIALLSKPLFLKMASTPFEYKKSDRKMNLRNSKKRPFLSSTIVSAKQIFRTPNIIYSVLAVAIITPIAIFLQNKIIAAMDTRILGNYMEITFNILMILLLTLSSNSMLASVFSREGNSGYINKTNPVEYKVLLTGKLVTNAVICIISIIISTIIINSFAHIGILATILLSLALCLIYLAHLFWSAQMDIMNPQNAQYQTTGEEQKNPNETKSTIFAIIISAIFSFVCFFLFFKDVATPVIVMLKLFLISIFVAFVSIKLYFTKIKLYYKEK